MFKSIHMDYLNPFNFNTINVFLTWDRAYLPDRTKVQLEKNVVIGCI